ncbi:putative nadh:ubiquinone oxidoreductase subunit [Diplodia seriata]|uniref:Putative nadh:ubiquinone oxidoreductase subunit n=1 Tax=Diplodia seriata TaxID=420778 RepID=A0A0G2FR34_9PEZI|nr:putative nadh:ubiquinone oxidoreductase subunit [Diplodia seriata]
MPQPGRLSQLWYRWKALNLPWRKQWLRGFDLAGNTFWEFKEVYGAQRFRRIVKYSRRTHFGDVKLTPAADARWAAKPSALDPPPQPQPAPQLEPRDPGAHASQTEPEERQGVRNVAGAPDEVKASTKGQEGVDKGRFKGETKEKTPAPWEEAKSQEWQPAPWTPKIARRKK